MGCLAKEGERRKEEGGREWEQGGNPHKGHFVELAHRLSLYKN